MRDFRNYPVYPIIRGLQVGVYRLCREWPKSDQFTLGQQVLKSVVSIGSNLAEGASRSSEKDFNRFLEIALGSAFELEHQLQTAKDVGLSAHLAIESLIVDLSNIQVQLGALRKKIRSGA